MTEEEKLKKAHSNTIQDNLKYSKNLYSDTKKLTKLELYFSILLSIFVVFAIVLLILKKNFLQVKTINILFIIDLVLTIISAVFTIIITIRDNNKGIHNSRTKLALSLAFMSIPIVGVIGILFFN